MRRDGRLLRAAALLSAAALTGAGAGAATATTVSTPQALQAAVATANASGGGAITLAPGTYALTAPLVISSPIRLVGPGRPEGDAGAAVITGSGARRILDVRPVAAAAATPAVSGLVLTQGSAGTGKGGAVVVATGARLVLRESTVSRSRASEGGGVHSAGSVLLDRVTLTGNTATSKGGGLENDGTAWVVNSTVDGNTAGGGGGVASAGTTRLRFSTITRNVSGNKNGGGLYRPGGVLEVEASIVSDNRTSSNAVHDCYGSPAFIGVNLIGNPQGCNPKGGTLVTGDARLGGLADNGGATQTRALGDGSAALDRVTGAPAALSTPLETAVVDSGVDQRRVTRPGGSGSDVGAFERAPLSVSATLTGPAEVRAGASQVMLDALGRLTGGGTSGAGSTLAAAPLTSIAPGGDLSATPLTSIPLTSIPLTSIPLTSIPLTSIPLSDVPLTGVEGGWDEYLAGTALAGQPLQTVTLGQVLELPKAATTPPTLGQLDLSATPLTSIPLTSILLAPLPLTSIPLSPDLVGATPQARLDEWCRLLGGPAECDRLDVTPQTTLISLALTGTPLTSIPLTSIPLTSIPLTSIPLTSIPLTSIPLTSIPLTSIPLTSIPLTSIPLTSIPLTSIPLTSIPLTSIELQANPLTSIPLTSIPLTSICPGCDLSDPDLKTVRDAAERGLLRGTLGDLLAALPSPLAGGVTLGDILLAAAESSEAGSVTLADLFRLLEGSDALDGLSLGDLLALLVPPGDLPWQDVDLTALPLPADPADDPRFPLVGTLTVGGATADTEARLTLPEGFTVAGPVALRRAGAAADTTLDSCAPGATTACTTRAGQVLTVRLPALTAGTHTITVPTRAGVTLGPATADLDVSTTTPAVRTARASWTGTVVEAFELGDTAEDVLDIAPGVLTVAHVASSGDADWYRFTAPAGLAREGTRAQIRLGGLDFDADLVLFGPRPDPIRGAPVRRVTSVEDAVIGLDPLSARLPTETLADVPLAIPGRADLVPQNVSATRGTTDETIESSPLVPGAEYIVQVSGYNGATSSRPFSLQLRLSTPAYAACPAVAGLGGGTPGTLPAGLDVPAGTDTLVLVNQQRLTGAYGAAGAASVSAALGRLAGAPGQASGVTAAVLAVDGRPAIRDAYTAWDQAPCSPSTANDVVRRIGRLIDDVRAANPDAPLTHVVVAGDDTQIPFARVPDLANLANERTYGASVGRTTATGGAMVRGYVLTDDPYGSDASVAVNGHELFIPARAVGRLVESPAEIALSVETFLDAQGRLDPATADERTALVAGYDFLTDGSTAVRDNLRAVAGDRVDGLINDTWTGADLLSRLLPAGDGPGIASVNAHFDHFRALPALGNATKDEGDLVSVGDLPGPGDNRLAAALLFSMGCHSGLNVSDVAAGRSVPDWAQDLARQRATWIGNTGYGYGDTETVAVTERLMAGFAGRLATTGTIGEALARAKQEYLSDTPLMSPYDEKASQQATFYGLPMYRMGGTGAPAAENSPVRLGDAPAAGTGVGTRTFALNLGIGATAPGDDAALDQNVTPRGRFYDVLGRTLAVQDRPLQPKAGRDVTMPGRIVRGAIVTALESQDLGAFDPVSFRPIVGESAQEPERTIGDGVFPAAIATVTGPAVPGSGPARLMLVPGQFREPVPGTGIGTQRLFTKIAGEVLGSDDATDFAPPGIETVRVTAAREIEVATEGGATRVVALVRPLGGLGRVTWTRRDLTETSPGVFRSAALDADPVQYIVQAADAAGNVGVASNKGVGYQTGERTPSEVDLVLCQPTGAPGDCRPLIASPGEWVAGPVTAALTSPAGLPLFISIDGEPFRPYTGPVTISGDGLHTVQGLDSQGGLVATEVRIDGTAPGLTAAREPDAGPSGWAPDDVRVVLTATDAASGPRTITLSATGDGAFTERTVAGATGAVTVTAEGTTTVTAVARDAAGNASAPVQTVVRIDRTAPSAPTVSGGSLDWRSLAGITFSATAEDAGSGVAGYRSRISTDGGTTWGAEQAGATREVTAEGETLVQFQAVDGAGRASDWAPAAGAPEATARLDRTAPTAPVASGGSLAWQRVPSVTVTATGAADDRSGVARVEYRTSVAPTPVGGASVTIAAEGETTVQFRTIDTAGNASDWAPAAPTAGSTVRLDRTAPTITITSPAEGAAFSLGQAVAAAFTCADAGAALSGSSCTGPVANGASVNTSTPGTFTFTVTATDRAGNTATASRSYSVAYRVCLDYNPSKAGNIGATFPIKLRLCDAAGRNLSSSAITLRATEVARVGSGTSPALPPNDAGSSNSDPSYLFRLNAADSSYIYNLKTDGPGFVRGSYVLRFVVNGTTAPVYEAPFSLR